MDKERELAPTRPFVLTLAEVSQMVTRAWWEGFAVGAMGTTAIAIIAWLI